MTGFGSGLGNDLLLGGGFNVGLATQNDFSPLQFGSDLQLWLDAQDESTMFTTTAETTLSTAGANVGRWKDKSGNNRHADKHAAGTTNFPKLTASALNGKTAPSWNIAGVTIPSLLAPFATSNPSATKIPGGQKFEIWVVTQTSTNSAHIVNNDDPGTFGDYWALWTGGISVFQQGYHMYYKKGVNAGDAGFVSSLGTARVIRGTCDTTLSSAAVKVSVDGTFGSTVTGYNPNFSGVSSDTRAFCIGSDKNGTYNNKGAVGEVIYVSRLLTDGEAASMQTYLTKRWL